MVATTSEKRAKTNKQSTFLAKEISTSEKQGKYFLPVIKKHFAHWQLSARQFWHKKEVQLLKEQVFFKGFEFEPLV